MPSLTAFPTADLPQNRPTGFNLRPLAPELAGIAKDLELTHLRKLAFVGEISSQGRHDYVLTGKLGATVIQPCILTLEPVTTRIDTNVRRVFLASLPDIDLGEVEMHADENIELLGKAIDPFVVMVETLALLIPQYPRKDGADLKESNFTEPGQIPMTDEDARPFAGLADLGKALKNDE